MLNNVFSKLIRSFSRILGVVIAVILLLVPYGEVLGVKIGSIIKILSSDSSQSIDGIMSLVISFAVFLLIGILDMFEGHSYTILDESGEEDDVSYRTLTHCLMYAAATSVACIVCVIINSRIVKENHIDKNPTTILILLTWAILNIGDFVAYFLERNEIANWEYRRKNIDVDQYIAVTQDEYDDEDEIEEEKTRLEKQNKAFAVPIMDVLVYLTGIVVNIIFLVIMK